MDFRAYLEEIRSSPAYAGQVVHVHEEPARPARYADPARPLSPQAEAALAARGIGRLYTHQAEALDRWRAGEDVLAVTGTASGKSLCYLLPLLETLIQDPQATALLLFPTKALCQDQCLRCAELLEAAGLGRLVTGVYDGDTPADLRRKLRDHGSILFTNPDMLHSALMPQHARWARFLARLRLLVIDELHVYNGLFGANAANLFRRFRRVCAHHGASPRIVACSATIANPRELAETLTGRRFSLVEDDGSPRGRRLTVFWNPPVVRGTPWRSRRSANVEAHELMADLVRRGVPTITFSKAKMTAEMISRYVKESLRQTPPGTVLPPPGGPGALAGAVAAYRGGYLPEERRAIERRLFEGELLGVSATNALELGIDVGGLDASILVGYPGTIASFQQQSGRAGRRDRDALVVLVGLDTPANQYVMSHPEYLFGRPVERALCEPDNPFVLLGHLRCAAHELPVRAEESAGFGRHSELVLEVLEEQRKVARIDGRWYHAASETPQHEVSLRSYADVNVVIEDADTGRILGELNRFDAPPLLHPEAIYLHHGETYRVLTLDQRRNVARVKREEVDYYTYPLGGTDVHHVDSILREKPFGAGRACWGEVTVHFDTMAYEKVRFYTMDAVSVHPVELETQVQETMALWVIPPEELMAEVRRAGFDVPAGLRGIGYAARMTLPLFLTCDTPSFSHSVGSANSPWNALFVYERYPLGLGFTEQAFDRLHEILSATLETIRSCGCADGCPCCVGKPLRQAATWNVERGEGSVPSKAAARLILEGLLAGGALQCPDTYALHSAETCSHRDRPGVIPSDAPCHSEHPLCHSERSEESGNLPARTHQHPRDTAPTCHPEQSEGSALRPAPTDADEETIRLRELLRRRMERMREPTLFHPIDPHVSIGTPAPEPEESLAQPDSAIRAQLRAAFNKALRSRIAQGLPPDGLLPDAPRAAPPPNMHAPGSSNRPSTFSPPPDRGPDSAPASAIPDVARPAPTESDLPSKEWNQEAPPSLLAGDSLAARARRVQKEEKG